MPDQGWHLQQIIGAYVLQIAKLQADLDTLTEQVKAAKQTPVVRQKAKP